MKTDDGGDVPLTSSSDDFVKKLGKGLHLIKHLTAASDLQVKVGNLHVRPPRGLNESYSTR